MVEGGTGLAREKGFASDAQPASFWVMKFTICFLSLVLGVATAQVEVSVSGLQVVGPGYVPEGEDNKMMDELQAFNGFSGTKVGVLVKTKEKSIVNLDQEKSKVTVFGDETGTDLTKAKARFSSGKVDFGFPDVSKDGKALMLEIGSAGVPAKGAQNIILKGELVVGMASKSELVKSEVTELKEGAVLVSGKHSFTVKKFGKPEWGDDPFGISLTSNVSYEDFKAVKFYDAEGKEIEADRTSSGSMGVFGKRNYSVSYSLKKKVAQIVLGLDGWTDLEEVKVPFDFKVGAGL